MRRGAALVVVDPRETELAHLATLWLRPAPGTEIALLAGMARYIVDEGLLDKDFVTQHCEGLDELRASLEPFSPEEVQRITGVARERLMEAARTYATRAPAAIFYATGVSAHGSGAMLARGLVDLALLTGNLGKPASGVNPLRADANSQGATDIGCVPDMLPGYAPIAQHADIFQIVWGMPLPPESGMGYCEMMEAAKEGRIKAMFIVADTQRVDGVPDLEALESVEFLVVQDIFLTEAAQRAHVVLPAATFAEKDGTYTNAERRVQRVRKVIDPVGGSRPGWQIICDLAQKMGADGFEFEGPARIMEEISSVVPIYGGISYERLGVNGLQWPCPAADHPGTPVLHAEGIARGKGLFKPVAYELPSGEGDPEYPLMVMAALAREVKGVLELNGEIVATLNREDAASLDIASGDMMDVVTRIGTVTARAKVSPDSPRGTVFLAYPHTETMVKTLYNAPADPVWDPSALNLSRAKAVKLSPVGAGP